MTQKLKVYQSRWAMELRRPDGVERSDEEAFEMVAEAGFDGMCLDLGASEIDVAKATLPLFRKHGLGCMINAFPNTLEDLQPVLDMAKEFEADYVNIIGQVMPFTVEEGETVVRHWMAMADRAGVPILFETHRNCITNDLFYTLQLMDRVPNMPICADLSHYIVDREFWFPLSDGDQALIRRILERADSFQGRIAGREQVQLQIDFPQHQKWVEQFKAWWAEGFRSWKSRHAADDTMIFLTELGPPEYAITGPDGFELSDRWEEALKIKGWVEEIWAAT
ncbi:MAG: TIM barrel protein [Alphaproteobacteria bacterium]|nr:TIM barrel protein [Alphaproteobacteria bacterium]